MKRLCVIEAMGYEPVAWRVPNIGNRKNGKGKRYRFTTQGRKTDLSKSSLSLADWKTFIREAAREAMQGHDISYEPLHVHFEFYGRTPPGRRHGELWDVRLVWDKKAGANKSGAWVKKNRVNARGNSINEADLTNLIKAAEDALQDIVFVNDCNNRILSGIALFGPTPGVRIFVSHVGSGDYPGDGEPVE